MATVVPLNRRTRSSVETCVTPTHSPGRIRTTGSTDRQRSAKRRVVYPADETSSPAKRTRRASSLDDYAENSSPIKVPSKSFYGGGKGRYLSPLERKNLEEIRQKNLSPPLATKELQQVEKQVKSPPVVVKPPRKSPRAAVSSSNSKGPRKVTPRRTSLVKKTKSPLQEIPPGSPRSPLKNKVIKEEKRVYSPSRSGRKFFKSRRVSDSSGQPANLVQRNALRVKYQPQGVVSKPKETNEKPKLLMNSTTVSSKPKNSPIVKRAVIDSPVVKTRSSPRKQPVKNSQSSGRSTIASSKNPNSQDLFSPSDWDFDDEEDGGSVFCSLPKETEFLKVNGSTDSGQVSRESSSTALSNCSLAGDSVALLSDLSEKSGSPVSPTDKSTEASEIPDTPEERKVYSIFRSKGTKSQDRTSAKSTPRSKKKKVPTATLR